MVDSVSSDRPAESTADKIQRELGLAGEGVSGFADAARDAFTNHKTETALEAGGAIAVGLGIATIRRLPGVGIPLSAAISAGLLGATIKNVADNGFAAVGAFVDNWQSADNLQTNKEIVRKDVGQFAFDTTVMAGAAGLSAGLMRGFGPSSFGWSRSSNKAVDPPKVDNPNAQTGPEASAETALSGLANPTGDLTSVVAARANGNSRVPVSEAYTRNTGAGESHWMAQSLTDSRFPSVKGDVDVDIAIIGGGTGTILATDLAAQGYKVALVDAGRIAAENATLSGMAGIGTRSMDASTAAIAAELGIAKTQRMMDIITSGQRWLQQRADGVGAFRRGTSFSVSRDLADLQNEAKLLTKVDSGTRFLTGDQISASIPNAAGAIAVHNEGMIDPVRLARQSIARELARPGSQLQAFEHSPVLSMSVDSRVHLELPQGRIHADRVLDMTGLPSTELSGVDVPLIRKQVYAVTADVGNHTLPPGAVFDDSTFTFYSPLGGNKIVFGGAGTLIEHATAADTAATKVGPLLNGYFPGASIENAWQRQIAAAPDRRGIIDYSPKHGPKVIVASAFGGTGYLFTGATRQLINPLLAGQPHPFPEAFGLDRPALR